MFKIDKIVFFNNYHNGDIHNSRELIKKIMNVCGNNVEYEYAHSRGPNHLKDISVKYISNTIVFTNFLNLVDGCLYINTHFGAIHNGNQFCSIGCNSEAAMNMLNSFYSEFNIDKKEIDEWNLVPEIDYDYYKINSINNFFKNYTSKAILICNGPVHSGQCPNFSFDDTIINFSKMYEDIFFITTKKLNTEEKNIICTDQIISDVNGSDLNEISYLSKYCSIVIGRASGPFMFAQTKETLDDKDKTFISFNSKIEDAFFSQKGKSKKIWSNNYNADIIANIINESILANK